MSTTRTVALFMLVTAVAACAKNEANRAADTTRVDTTAAAPSMGPAPADTAAAASTAALSDPNIVFILHGANAADSARGKLAESKGTSADVKSFGKMMVGEHHALNMQGDQLAKKLNVTPVAPANDRLEVALKASDLCTRRTEVEKLRALPVGQIAAPVEITPALLLSTQHSAVASGHHRNASGINDVLELFLEPPGEGAKILARRHVDYVVVCRGAPESIRFANRAPGGLASMLRAGKAPAWLQAVGMPGMRGLKVWRVRQDLIAARPLPDERVKTL